MEPITREGANDMQPFKFLMPLDVMERISQKELGDGLESILERVDKEDIGVVILNEEGKDRYVLCPARWMHYCFDDEFGCIITSAIRYAIGRHTYMPSTVVSFVRKYMHILDSKTIDVAIRDITRELENDNVEDPEMWKDLRLELRHRRAFYVEKQQT